MALSRLGGSRNIVHLDTDDTTAAKLCRIHYPHCRDSVLREHPWNFAVRRVALAASATAPQFEYTYAFPLPGDCLKVIRTSWEANGWWSADLSWPTHELAIPYRIETVYTGTAGSQIPQKCLLTNESSVSIEYVSKITDPTLFDPMFTEALICRVAMAVCLPLTSDKRQYGDLYATYREAMGLAKTVDAQEGSTREVVDASPFILSRL